MWVVSVTALVQLVSVRAETKAQRATVGGFQAASGRLSSTDAALGASLDGCLRRWEAFGFSGAVIVAHAERMLLRSGYGLADRSREIAVTPETLFDIGSLSKQFTATAVLKLAEAGKLRIDDPIASILPGVPEDKRPITIHQLLTHTSGVSDFGRDTDRENRDQLVGAWLDRPLTSLPGTTYEYSNLGYSVLAAIVELVSGQSFETYLHHALFEPAGLRDTILSWEAAQASRGKVVAMGYGGFADPCGGEDPRIEDTGWRLRGSGCVLSSADDLLRWGRALGDGRMLGRDWVGQLFRPYTKAEADFLSYGYGWRLQTTSRGTRVVWHSGLEGAFSAVYRRYVDEDLTIVFLTNRSIDGVPMRDLLVRPAHEGLLGNLVFGGPAMFPPAVPERASEAPAAGVYGGHDGARWSLEPEGGGLMLRAQNQKAADLLGTAQPDAASSELSEAATRRAEAAVRALLEGDLDRANQTTGQIDPLGYTGRDLAAAVRDWKNREATLGPLRSVEVIASCWVRQGPRERQVTHLRLRYERGTADEHFLWYADDEAYLIPCAPESTALRVKPLDARRLFGFDPVGSRSWTISFTTGQDGTTNVEATLWRE
jgi:CubicO group peptidase (beta-lactamase class C family)